MATVCVAFKAHQGWASAVAVGLDSSAAELLPLLGRRVQIVDPDNRELAEPYHVAGGWQGLEQSPRPANPESIIARARQAQAAGAAAALTALNEELTGLGHRWRLAVVCVRRGVVHDLEGTLSSHAHIHIAEADAIRDALRCGLESIDVPVMDQDEKSVPERLAERLGVTAGELDERLKARKPADAGSWRKEDRMLAMAAALGAA